MEILENQKTNTSGATPKIEPKLTETPVAIGSIGFVSRDLFVMNSNQGSGYTNAIAKEIGVAFGKLPGTKPRINILDKESVSGLAYSAIVVSFKNKDSVNYYTIALEATGKRPMTAGEMITEVNATRNPNQRPMIFTPEEAIDDVLHKHIMRTLVSEYGDVGFVSNSGIVVPTHHEEVVVLANNLAAIAYNAVTIDALITSKQIEDLNITKAIKTNPNLQLRIDENFNLGAIHNEIGRPVRTDFIVELNAHDVTNQVTSINLQNSKEEIVKVGGYIDAIFDEVPAMPTQYGMPMGMLPNKIRLYPHIIITSNAAKTPTTGNALLGLVSSLVMLNPAMWLAGVLPKNGKDLHNCGALNIVCNIGNNQNGIGEPVDLTSKSLDKQEVYSMIKNMYSLSPIVSMDIELFGPQSFYNTVFQVACENRNTQSGINAAAEIIESAHWLTNGAFPRDFNLNDIFVSNGVYVPLGTWADKSGERDIRDIDLSFLANATGDVELMNKWNLGNLPKDGNNGTDPFLTKVSCINSRIPDAVINGKALRVTFSSKFIMTLGEAVTMAGLNVRYEPSISFGDTYSLQNVSQFMAGAGINGNAHGFARQQTVAGPAFTVFGPNMGTNRY